MLVDHTGQRVLSICSGAEAVQYSFSSICCDAKCGTSGVRAAKIRRTVKRAVYVDQARGGIDAIEPLPKLCSTFSVAASRNTEDRSTRGAPQLYRPPLLVVP